MNGCQVDRLDTGRVRVTIGAETLEASPAFWRAVLFDAIARDQLQPVVTRHLREPVAAPAWWLNGDGR